MLKNMRIGLKLMLGFGVVVALLAGVMGAYHYVVRITSGNFNQLMQEEITIANYAGEIESLMLQCRRSEKDFLLRKDMKHLEEHKKKVAELIKKAKILVELTKHAGYQQDSDRAEQLTAHARDYGDAFRAVAAAWEIKGLDHESGLQGKFRGIVHTVTDKIKEYQVDDLYIALLQMRGYEKNHISEKSDKGEADVYGQSGNISAGS